jgi:predicted phosphoribosyltransferase
MSYNFKNRQDAAMALVDKLKNYKDSNGIVLAIPRGGVPIGYTISKELGLPLEITLSKKIGHPNNPEFAVGSVCLQGVVIDEQVKGISKKYIDEESKRLMKLLQAKYKLYMGNRKPTDLEGKIVIIVDDGIATGNTIKATIIAIRKNNPKKIIVVVPVSPKDTAIKMNAFVDEFICLQTPLEFYGVGQFYDDFLQVSDEEVIELLEKSNAINS